MNDGFIIDVREACREQRTGKGQWTYGLVNELRRRQIPLTLLTDRDPPQEWSGLHIERIAGRGFRWHRHVIRWLKQHANGRTYFSPTSYIVPALAPRRLHCIPVVHDLIAFRHEPHDRKATFIERLTLPRVVRRCRVIATISQSTKHDLLSRYSHLKAENVVAVFAGPMHPHPPLPHPDHRTILCIATLCPRKNQARLIDAYARLPDDLRGTYRLVLAGGRGWHDASIIETAKSTAGVEWRGYVDNAQYEKLLHSCAIFALPSLYEGFGMQILDALQRGIPVLTSDRGSLRELAEGVAVIVNPEDSRWISDGLEKLLRDDGLRRTLSEKGRQRAAVYSWQRTADLLLQATEKLV